MAPFSKASEFGTSLLSVWCWDVMEANSMLPVFKMAERILYTELTSCREEKKDGRNRRRNVAVFDL